MEAGVSPAGFLAADAPVEVSAEVEAVSVDFPVAEGPQAGLALLWEAAFITADPVADSHSDPPHTHESHNCLDIPGWPIC